jgi:hypothetical protein
MKRNKSRYWFLRSFFISFVLFLCAETLILGMGYCHSVMETNLKGEKVSLIERQGEQIKILGHIVKK